jgi:hypothetical protein
MRGRTERWQVPHLGGSLPTKHPKGGLWQTLGFDYVNLVPHSAVCESLACAESPYQHPMTAGQLVKLPVRHITAAMLAYLAMRSMTPCCDHITTSLHNGNNGSCLTAAYCPTTLLLTLAVAAGHNAPMKVLCCCSCCICWLCYCCSLHTCCCCCCC